MTDAPTQAQVEAIATAIEDHAPRDYAALMNGVSPDTLDHWIENGEIGVGGPLCLELARRVHRAEAERVQTTMQRLHTLGERDGLAAKTYLEFQHPERFAGKKPLMVRQRNHARDKRKRARLFANPPPRMLQEAREHGWWRFHPELEPEDKATLESIQAKYAARPALQEG